jgi:hypothetical protein
METKIGAAIIVFVFMFLVLNQGICANSTPTAIIFCWSALPALGVYLIL